MKSPVATQKSVKEIEINVQGEMRGFISAALRQGLKQMRQILLADEVMSKVKAKRYNRSSQRQGYWGGIVSGKPQDIELLRYQAHLGGFTLLCLVHCRPSPRRQQPTDKVASGN